MKVNQLRDVLCELTSKLRKDGRAQDAEAISSFARLLYGQEESTVAAFAKGLKARGSSHGA